MKSSLLSKCKRAKITLSRSDSSYQSFLESNFTLSRVNFVYDYSSSMNCYFHKTEELTAFTLKRGKFKGCGMGPWVVLVSPCFRENVVATCKIGSFLCSLDNLLQKNVIVLFFGNQISKWRSFEKKGLFLTYFWHFLVTREKLQKFLQHISHFHTNTYFAHPIDYFCLTNFEKKYEFIRYGFSLVWVLVLILIRAILEQSINNNMVGKI